MSKVYNFYPGPAVLPRPVLEQVQQELLDYQGTGMSILELSHRSRQYEGINAAAEARLKRLLGLDDDYRVLFLQGGATLQFAMVPLNFLRSGTVADYLLTSQFAEKAYEEAARIGQARIAASTSEQQHRRLPAAEQIQLSPNAAYVHLTSNNTIEGTQWPDYPDVGDRPLVADMTSDVCSRPFDARRFALIYAAAQKNLGPAGVTVVILRQSWLAQANPDLPSMLRYSTFAKNNSLYNTAPVFAVYMVDLVLDWIEQQGGLEVLGQRNREKAQVLYDALDASGGFYRGHAEAPYRSLMNVTFRLPDEELERQFVNQAKAQGMVGLAGHRSVGGIRASIYNAMSLEGCQTLAQFMGEFVRRHG